MALAESWLGGPGRRGWELTGSSGRWKGLGGPSRVWWKALLAEVGGPGPPRPPLGSTLEKTSRLLSKFALQGLG